MPVDIGRGRCIYKTKMAKLRYIFTALCVVVMIALTACGGDKSPKKTTLSDQIDSVSYIVGMNIGYNILKMDTSLRAEAVVKGISDALAGKEKIDIEEARTYFLAYMNYDIYERVRGYEEQYLNDLAASDKAIQRTETGLTYQVHELGDMNNSSSSERDTVKLVYHIAHISDSLDAEPEKRDTVRTVLRDCVRGLKEGVKLIGQGGKITLWVPSELAFGAEGDAELGIAPNEMLRYEVEVLEVKRRRR